ncbi:uncharacterized protein C8R40DRAFT_1274155 [Lentinula edodes]|uniref:uncharacterized protein n=1 Tax=Lentinula edodes TaxID=5353 RepID=UPI001E8DC7C0|nr:uncharacterized protein C8R40DRAFT_1274155 [Lentinula edodes]KAH7871536.1 hypothetical protein C8R40DRAFT_1274155 [Lentinula edodes]
MDMYVFAHPVSSPPSPPSSSTPAQHSASAASGGSSTVFAAAMNLEREMAWNAHLSSGRTTPPTQSSTISRSRLGMCIAGSWACGLAAAIRLKQLEREAGSSQSLRVVVLEKGSEVGAHIVSGCVLEPRALHDLLGPDPSQYEQIYNCGQPPLGMNNQGNFVISLSALTRWLGRVAEEYYGVEIYPGFAGAGVVFSDEGIRVRAHGSLTKTLITKYRLRNESDPQTYGFGLKEIWRLPDSHPLYTPGSKHLRRGWVYHMDANLLSIGLVVGADWENPYRSPYRDFQMMKHHPYIRRLLSPATRIAYAARVLTKAVSNRSPFCTSRVAHSSGRRRHRQRREDQRRAHRNGDGDPRCQGVWDGCQQQANENDPIDTSPYTTSFLSSWIHTELHETRNLRPSFSSSSVLSKRGLGVLGGVLYSGVDTLLLKGRTPWTFRHTKNEEERRESLDGGRSLDSLRTDPSTAHTPIPYPPFDPPLSTDLLTSLMLTGTSHEEDQPEHLRYAGLLARACPAGVYDDGESWNGKKLVINAQNCIHCKLCDIKVPSQDITWTVPEGGGGPKYIEIGSEIVVDKYVHRFNNDAMEGTDEEGGR